MNEKASCITINCGCCGNGGTSGGSGAENVYSTEETVCGTWIDGKPIYRKVIVGKTAVESSKDGIAFADVASLKIEKMISLYGNMSDKTNFGQISLPYHTAIPDSFSKAAITMWYRPSEEKLYYTFINNYGNFSSCTAYVILEYTKRTDSASPSNN